MLHGASTLTYYASVKICHAPEPASDPVHLIFYLKRLSKLSLSSIHDHT